MQSSASPGSAPESDLPASENRAIDVIENEETEKGGNGPELLSQRPEVVVSRASHLTFLAKPPSAKLYSTFWRMKQSLKARSGFRYLLGGEKGDTLTLSSASRTLLRMAAMRRIVTSLGRLLGTKGEVVTQMRKRLLSTFNTTTTRTNAGEFAVHMGDIQGAVSTHVGLTFIDSMQITL